MRTRMMVAAMAMALTLLSADIADAHSFTPYGWSGPYSGGHTGSGSPEDLCKNFTSRACIIGSVSTLAPGTGVGLGKWPIYVSNNIGTFNFVQYTTNTANTKGWIVVSEPVGAYWTFQAYPGTHNGVTCNDLNPNIAQGWANTSWGTSRYYHQANLLGYKFGGFPCS